MLKFVALVIAFLAASSVAAQDFEWIANVVAATMAERAELDVLTAQDLKTVMELEAEKQVMGCDTSSCLAEIAGAMNANIVVYGTLSALDEDNLLLQLNVFDAEAARAVGRKIVRAKDATELSPMVEQAARELTVSIETTEKVRVIVLDITATDAQGDEVGEPEPEGGVSALLLGGAGVAALGVASLVVGASFDFISVQQHEVANDASLSAAEARAGYDDSDGSATIAAIGYVAGAVLFIAGGAAMILGGIE